MTARKAALGMVPLDGASPKEDYLDDRHVLESVFWCLDMQKMDDRLRCRRRCAGGWRLREDFEVEVVERKVG